MTDEKDLQNNSISGSSSQKAAPSDCMPLKDDKNDRLGWIDAVRLLAMLIVCMNHAGLTIKGVNFWGGMFYVPVFFMISGFFWKRETLSIKDKLRSKIRRLICPYILTNLILISIFLVRDIIKSDFSQTFFRTFGFLYGRNQLFSDADTLFRNDWLLHMNSSGENTYFMTALNSPTWFLPALFLTIFSAELLYVLVLHHMHSNHDSLDLKERLCEHRVILGLCILLLLDVLWHYLTPLLLPWSMDALGFFTGFFIVGHLLGQWDGWKWLTSRRWIIVLLAITLIPGGIINGSANYSVGLYGKSVMLAFYNAMASCLIIMYLCYLASGHIPGFIIRAGRKTLPLLCWHFPLISAMEAVRQIILPSADGILLSVCKAVEIAAAIALICIADDGLLKLKGRIDKNKAV